MILKSLTPEQAQEIADICKARFGREMIDSWKPEYHIQQSKLIGFRCALIDGAFSHGRPIIHAYKSYVQLALDNGLNPAEVFYIEMTASVKRGQGKQASLDLAFNLLDNGMKYICFQDVSGGHVHRIYNDELQYGPDVVREEYDTHDILIVKLDDTAPRPQ